MAQDHILLEILYEEAVENGTESAQKIAAQLEELRCCTPSDQKSAKQIRTIEDADTPNWCPNQQLYSQDDFATDKALYQQLCDMIGQVLVYIQENAGSLSQEIDNGRIINALTLFRENANGALQLFNLPKPDAKNYYSSYFKCRLMSLNLRRERGTQNNLDISNSLFNQLKDSATTAVNKLYPLQKITVIDKLFNFLCSIFRIQYTKVAVKQHLTEQLGQIRRTLDGQLFEQSVGSAAEQAAQSEQSANRVPVL